MVVSIYSNNKKRGQEVFCFFIGALRLCFAMARAVRLQDDAFLDCLRLTLALLCDALTKTSLRRSATLQEALFMARAKFAVIVATALVFAAAGAAHALVADYWEPDNELAQASTITVGPAGAQIGHTIHVPGDEDFIRFTAQPGRYYRIETYDLQNDPANLNPNYHGMDTVLTLFDSDGVSVLDEDDNSGEGRGSLIELFNELQRTLYIRVTHQDGIPAVGTGTYSLRVLDLGGAGTVGTRIRRWQAGTGSFTPPALGLDGTIYAGGSEGLYAFKPDGTVNVLSFSHGAYAVPVVRENGRVIAATAAGTVYEMESDLSVVHVWHCGGSIWGAAALGSDGTIYVGSTDGLVYALANDGTIAMTWNIGSPIHGSPVVGTDGTVYVGAVDGLLYALAADGSIPRTWDAGGPVFGAPAIGLDGIIYTASQASNLCAFLPDGTTGLVWRTFGSVYAGPAIRSDGAIMVADVASNVYALAADGSAMMVWTLGGAVVSTPSLAADGMALVAALDGRVYGLAPNGDINFAAVAGEAVHISSPLIDDQGRFTICATDGRVSMFHGTAPLANSPWPMFQHDIRHSGHAAPLIPEGVKASCGTLPGRVVVRWQPVAGAERYFIWRATEENTAAAVCIGDTTGLAFNDSSALPGIEYVYWVRSAKGQARSEFSASAHGWIGGFAFNDFDGNGMSDFAVYATEHGTWCVADNSGAAVVWNAAWGSSGMTPVMGDYDGDGVADLAVYQESAGLWFIRTASGDVVLWATPFGGPGFKPVPGDYDGDGIFDLALYNRAAGLWFIVSLDGRTLLWAGAWGDASMRPVPGDYDGDFAYDLALYSDTQAAWFICSLSKGVLAWNMWWGGSNFYPVSGDYDGDGISDLAMYCLTTGNWYILTMRGTLLVYAQAWGGPGLIPISGDYDGDGISDLAVYDEAAGVWHVASLDGRVIAFNQAWGGPGFSPVMHRW